MINEESDEEENDEEEIDEDQKINKEPKTSEKIC